MDVNVTLMWEHLHPEECFSSSRAFEILGSNRVGFAIEDLDPGCSVDSAGIIRKERTFFKHGHGERLIGHGKERTCARMVIGEENIRSWGRKIQLWERTCGYVEALVISLEATTTLLRDRDMGSRRFLVLSQEVLSHVSQQTQTTT